MIENCIRAGTLYESKEHHNCVFVGKDENNKARFASLRGTASHFKLDISGSDKRYGFHIPAEIKDCSLLEVFESPIDAMSGASIKLFLGEIKMMQERYELLWKSARKILSELSKI